MQSKIYVGNISFITEKLDLQKHFSQYGTVVSVNIIKDKRTGKNMGFAFIEMSNHKEAAHVIEKFNETDFKGSFIKVKMAEDT